MDALIHRKIARVGGRFVSVFLQIALLSVTVTACASVASPTPTEAPTQTAAPSATPTPLPSTPTATARPSPTNTPIPARLGEPVRTSAIEVTLLDVYRHDRIYTGDNYYHYANPGYVLIDLFVRIRNLGADPVNIVWYTIRIKDEGGTQQSPSFAGAKFASRGEKIDPFSIHTDITVTGGSSLTVPAIAYLRLYYVLRDKPEQIVRFGIGDSPVIQFVFKN
jgi:hypothetical protein